MIKKASLIIILSLATLGLSSCGNETKLEPTLPTPVATAKAELNFSDMFREKVESVVRKVNVKAALESATINQNLFDVTKNEIFGTEKNDFVLTYTAPDLIKATGTVSTSYCEGEFSLSVSYEAKFKCKDTTKE